jgi:DNA polymerase elongation subunit (family B)
MKKEYTTASQSIDLLLDLKGQGFSSREIANITGFSKSAINYALAEARGEKRQRKNKGKKQAEVIAKAPRILILDLETSADIVATFGRRQVNISQSNILHEGNEIISAAWMWYDEGVVESLCSDYWAFEIDPESEQGLLRMLIALLNEADAVVIHNARFDLGTIQHRMLAYGMGKIPTVKVIDTLQLARKYLKLRSNKLEAIAKYFKLSDKMQNEGITLWIKTQSGDLDAMQTMLEYNEKDVEALRDVYRTFQPLSTTFNQGLLVEASSPVCGACGSTDVSPTGRLVHTTVSSFTEYECHDCGAKLRDRKSVVSKQKKENLLIAL